MTAEEEFKKWWADHCEELSTFEGNESGAAEEAYLAAAKTYTKATAARCVEICESHSHSKLAMEAIRKEYGLE
jgi:hypothetical protein